MPAPSPANLIPLPARAVPDPGAQGLVTPNLTGAGVTPKLDVQAAMAPALGMARVGQGVEQLGEAATKLYEQKNTADTITAEYAYAREMETARHDIGAAIAGEPDQSKWSGLIDDRMGQLKQTLANVPNVPKTAKPALDQKLAMFSIDTYGGAKEHAVQRSLADAVKGTADTVERAGMIGDMDLGMSTIALRQQQGYITDAQADLERTQLGKKVDSVRDRQEKEAGLQFIQDDPEKAYKAITSGEYKASPENKEYLTHQAHAAMNQAKAATMDGLMSKVDSGEFVVPAQVDAEKDQNPKITEEQAAHAKRAIASINNADRQQWNTENSSKTISGAMSAIRAYDPKSDPDRTQYDAINSYISSNLVTGDKEQARQALSSRASGKAIAEKDPLMQTAVKTITDMQQKGEFGQFSRTQITPIESTDPDGTKHTYHRQQTVIDRDAQARSRDLSIQVEASVRDFVKRNPKATNEDVLNEIHRVTPDYISARAVGGLYGIPKQGPVPDDQTQPASSVPTRSDPADIIKGLPQYPERIPKAGQVDDEPAQKPVASAADDSTETGIHVAAGAVPVESLKASLPSGLKPHAQDFKDAADETGLDPRFLAAVSMFETGNGTSPAFRNKNNAMGISDARGPTAQASVRDSIFRQARALSNPKGPYRNAKTVEQVAAIYSPPGAENDPNKTNGEWPEAVKKNLRRLKGRS